MRERTVLLESLFLIRTGSRDPGQHFLVQEHLVGASNEPFAFREIRVIAAATRFFGGNGLFLQFWVSAFNSL